MEKTPTQQAVKVLNASQKAFRLRKCEERTKTTLLCWTGISFSDCNSVSAQHVQMPSTNTNTNTNANTELDSIHCGTELLEDMEDNCEERNQDDHVEQDYHSLDDTVTPPSRLDIQIPMPMPMPIPIPKPIYAAELNSMHSLG
jgi:hypothetical protein